MEKEKYTLYSETSKLIDKEELRANSVFWFLFGFISAAVLILIFITSACIPF